ncbi:hypothetical protein ABPG73_011688 [Tetrahymena malaccensis]
MEGILVINALNNQLVLRQTFNQYVNTLEVTKDGNYVFTNLNSQLTIMSFESRTSLQILGSSNFPTNITNIVIDNKELRVYAIGIGGFIVAYDIQNKKDIQQVGIFNTQSVTAHSAFVSPDDNWIFVANDQKGLYIMKIMQSIFIQTSTSYYKWRCYCKSIGGQNYFFGAFDQEGLFIYNITDPYNFKTVYRNQFINSLIDSIAFANNLKYMMLPIQENSTSIIVYDISVLDSPQEAFRLQMDQLNHDEAIFISKDQKLIGLSFDDGVLLIKYDSELQLLQYWKKFGYMIGENAGVMITNDNRFLIGCVRGYGYYVLSINLQNEQNVLAWEYTLQTFGGEGIIPSNYYDNYAYIYDGFRGVGVIDTTVLPIIKIISRVQLQGWSNLIVPILNDDYFLVAQIESGMVSLIDSRNKTNMILISQLQYQSQTAQSLCTTEDYQYLFVNNNLGTLVMPLQSQIIIHTQFQQIKTDSNGVNTYQSLANNQFYIGQLIQMRFLILFPQEGTQIIGFQYYQNELIYDSPQWISFEIISQQITMALDKQALGAQHQNKNVNIILLKLAIPISNSTFVFLLDDGQTTSQEDSAAIFNILKQRQIITNENFVSDSFDYTMDLNISLNGILLSEQIQKTIRLTLQNSIYINQIQFFVSSSLVVDLEDSFQPIKTLSQQLQILFSVDSGQGKFILNNYEGVIASFSQAQEQLQVQGSLGSINKLLLSKIIFFSKQDMNEIDVSIQIQDSLNYPVTKIIKAANCNVLKQKYQIINNEKERLQFQFNNKYSEGIINIQELFQIDFSSDTFIDKDSTSINYNGYIINDSGEQNQIQFSSWIQFKVNNGQVSIQGTPSTQLFYQKIRIKIIADDGYTSISDEFIIKIYGVPFTIVLSLVIQILGPLVAVIKIYTYRFQILNFFYKNKVTFSKETVICGEIYSKRFIIMGDNMIKCIHLFKGFIIQYNKIAKTNQVINKNNSYLSSYSESMDVSITKQNKIREVDSESNYNLNPLQQQKQDFFFKNQKQDKLLQRIKKILDQENNKIKTSNIIQLQQQADSQISKFDSKFIDAIDGQIKVKNIIAYIKQSNPQFSISGKSYSIQSFNLDFKNQDSFIYKGIEALSARFFLKKDKLSFLIYQHLKRYSLRNGQYNLNDWYKQFVQIEYHDDSKDCFGQIIPFPTLSLKIKAIDQVLQQIQKNLNTKTCKQNGINLNLIQSVLFADTFGLVGFMPKKLSPCIGESIHLHSYQIHGVQTYQETIHGRCLNLKRILKINYNQYGASKNRSLPSWLEMEHKNNTIDLIGMPMSQDIEDIQIRVMDSNNFVIKQFTLSVIQSDSVLQSKNTNELDTTINRQERSNIKKLDQLEIPARIQSRSLTKKVTKLEKINHLRSQQNIQYRADKVINEENTKQTIDELIGDDNYNSNNSNNNMQTIRETKKSIFCFDKSMNQKYLETQDLIIYSSPKLSQKQQNKNDLSSNIDKSSISPTLINPLREKQSQLIQIKKIESQINSCCSLEESDINIINEDYNKNNIFKQDYFTPNKNKQKTSNEQEKDQLNS